jgi:hypothetical protein
MTASTGLKINPVSITDGTGMVVPGTTNVSSAGDLNGDGYDDLVIGVYAADPSGKNNAGSTYIVFGHAGFTTAPDLSVVDGTHVVRIDGEKAGDGNGWSVAGAGDVNGDGYSDLIVSSHQVVTASPGNPGVPGEAYVIYGHEDGFAAHIDLSTVKAEDGFKIDGLGSMGFGMTVSSAGDVNGDGYADLAISDYAKSATYIVFGGDFTGSVTHQGGAGDDAILGDANAQNIVAGAGNDVINAGGGKDSIEAGAGDDQIQIADGKFLHIDGGSGFDTLQMNYAGLIDFGDLDGNHATADHGKIESIEAINADNGQANTIIIDLADVLDINPTNHDVGGNASLDNVLKIDGDAGDTLALAKADGWGAADTASLAGYAVYTNQGVHVAVDTAIAVTVN